MGVSTNRGGPPKWMVKIMVPNPIKMDDLGGFPIIFERPRIRRTYHNFWPPASRRKRLRTCFVKISVSKIFADHPWKKKVPKTSRESGQLTTIFAPPRCEQNAAWRQCFAKTSVPKSFADHPWEKKVPKTNRESGQLTMIFGPPRCSRNAAWRQCFAKTSVPKIYADRPCNNKVPKTNRECDELTIIFGPPRCA